MNISVVIPLYNHAELLPYAVSSALLQGPDVKEILILDDHSTDNSLEVAKSLMDEDSRIKVSHSDHNAGIGTMRRVGEELFTGDYLCYLSSDDYWLPGFIDAMVKAYEDDDTIMFTGWEARRGKDVVESRSYNYDYKADLRDGYWATVINFSSIWIPRKVFQKIHFNPHLRACEDLLFERQAKDLGFKFKAIDQILCVRMIHPKQASSNPSTSATAYLGEAISLLGKWRMAINP